MGREVILKAALQAIPTYSMSCFKLTQTLCHELETMIRKFGGGKEVRGKFTGLNGVNCVGLRMKGGWISDLTMQC